MWLQGFRRLVIAKRAGVVESVDASRIVVKSKEDGGGVDIYSLIKFQRSNQATCINQKPIVNVGDAVTKAVFLQTGLALTWVICPRQERACSIHAVGRI